MASTNDLKNGMVLDLDGQLWSVVWFQHHKPGKGNTVVRTKLKHVLSGKVVDRTFNSDTKVDTASVDRREMQYLYHDGSGFVFMDTSTYEQLIISDETVGDAKNYLLEEQLATVAIHEGTPLYIDLPASVELVITYTEPGLQGDRSTGGTKPATVETGLQIQVPLFLTTGREGQGRYPDGGVPGPCLTAGADPADRRRSSTRSKARKRALDILFEAELRGHAIRCRRWPSGRRMPSRPYATTPGLWSKGRPRQRGQHRPPPLRPLATGWTLPRLPRVDRAALRIAVFELDHLGVPAAVVVSEAIHLVGELSTDESPAFVHGVLGSLVDTRQA